MNRERFPTPPWPDSVDELVEGQQYEKTHPVTGETVTVEVISIRENGPGVVTHYQEV